MKLRYPRLLTAIHQHYLLHHLIGEAEQALKKLYIALFPLISWLGTWRHATMMAWYSLYRHIDCHNYIRRGSGSGEKRQSLSPSICVLLHFPTQTRGQTNTRSWNTTTLLQHTLDTQLKTLPPRRLLPPRCLLPPRRLLATLRTRQPPRLVATRHHLATVPLAPNQLLYNTTKKAAVHHGPSVKPGSRVLACFG